MGYRSLSECVRDLERTGQLAVIDQEIDPHLEAAAIQRRVYQAGGPAVYFRRVKGTSFPALCNLFGTLDRASFLFRDTLEPVRRLVELKVDPGAAARASGGIGACRARSGTSGPGSRRGPILENQTTIERLPAIQSLADGRRTVHHPAPGLYRGPRPAWPGAVEPGDVPRSAFGQCSTSSTGKSASITRSIAGSGCIMLPRSDAASRCE